MFNIEIDNRTVQANDGETILTVCKREGLRIPTLCFIEGLAPSGACRMCIVEVEGFGGMIPACSYPVTAGMKVKTSTPRVLNARRTIVELLLSNHPDDCLYCLRNGQCDLQKLAGDMDVKRLSYSRVKTKRPADVSSPSIVRNPEKCILCGKCVRVCEEIQGVSAIDFIGRGCKAFVGTAFDSGLNVSTCINCGQCILVCPTGALAERSYVDEVAAALADPDKYVVVQHAPSVSVTLAEEFGVKPGKDVDGQMVAALRRMGFKRVFDTAFAADLTIMEESSELVHRIKTGGKLPMMTSCSPGWIKFVEQFYPDMIENISTCKSPQQMMGALIKSFFAQQEGMDPSRIVSVSIMPCTAKKFECQRPEMAVNYIPDVDYVLTTRELAQLFRRYGLELGVMTPDTADTPFGERTSAGKIFGATGGMMEAAIRSAYFLLTGQEYPEEKIPAIRGLKGHKEVKLRIGDLEVGAAVVSGLGNARKLIDEIKAGRNDLHFIEVMACPGGCISGGGQPIDTDTEAVKARLQALYLIDRDDRVRVSHRNESVIRLYREFLGEPLGKVSHHLLHTHYKKRDIMAEY
jgi:iron-only hydrogenase group A